MMVMLNGRLVPPEEALVRADSPAFQYGLGVFQTLRTYPPAGIFRPQAHLERLVESARILEIPLVVPLADMEDMLLRMADCASQTDPAAPLRFKLVMTGHDVILTAQPLTVNPVLCQGVALLPVEGCRSLPAVKALAYLDSLVPHRKAELAGCHDALLVDPQGMISEGAFSNVFWFEGERLLTRKEGVLPGVTRQAVMESSPFPVEWGEVSLERVQTMPEVFLTQTTTGVLPVTSIGGQPVGRGTPGPRTLEVMTAFDALTKKERR
ncbi:MAG: aminotransferase class IV [Deltaproteobacteria bacterium]|nr:aminotransferase class IV [Deltaproteobacteria bacterium]